MWLRTRARREKLAFHLLPPQLELSAKAAAQNSSGAGTQAQPPRRHLIKNAGLEAEEQELEPDKGRCRWCPQGAVSPTTTQHLPWKCGHFPGHKYSSSYLPWTTGFPSSSGKCLLKSQVRGSLFDYSSLYCLSSQRSMSSRFGPPNLPLLVLGRVDRHPLSLEPRGGLSGRPWSPLGCSLHN